MIASQALIPASENEPSFSHSLFPTPCERQTPWEADLASCVTSQRKSVTAGTLMLRNGSGQAYVLQVGEGEGRRPFLGWQNPVRRQHTEQITRKTLRVSHCFSGQNQEHTGRHGGGGEALAGAESQGAGPSEVLMLLCTLWIRGQGG